MQTKKLTFILLINFLLAYSCTCICTENLGDSWHFDSKTLRDPQLTKKKLIEDGCKQVYFENEGKTKLSGLFLERKDARATIIFTHGFCPGGKEAFAPFLKLAPDYCNLLFIDLKGYGESEGPNMLYNINNYGSEEYKDILGAIKFVNTNETTKNTPVIVFGWCAGAFNSATALTKLQASSTPSDNKIKNSHIKGLIFDSGFGSISEISDVPKKHIQESYLPGVFAKFYSGNKKRASQSYICQLTILMLAPLFKILEFFIKPQIQKREAQTNLYDKIQDLKTPVLIIHSQDDTYAKWDNVKELSDSIPNKEIWLIEKGKSGHANNHLKVKQEYKDHLQAWTDAILA